MKNKILKRIPVTPIKAIEILARNGIKVNEHQAEVILDFLKILAKSTIMRYFKEDTAASTQNIEPSIENQAPKNYLEKQRVARKIE